MGFRALLFPPHTVGCVTSFSQNPEGSVPNPHASFLFRTAVDADLPWMQEVQHSPEVLGALARFPSLPEQI